MPTKIKVTDIDADASASAKGLVQLTGCLGGTATAPTVVALKEGGGTTLTLGSVQDGQFIKRNGSTATGSNSLYSSSSGGGLISSTQAFFSSDSTSFTLPTGGANGDLYALVTMFNKAFGPAQITPPAGWDLRLEVGDGTLGDIRVYTRVRDGSEGTSVTLTKSVSDNNSGFAACLLLRGVNVYNIVNASGGGTGTGATISTTQVNTTTSCFIIQAVHARYGTPTSSAGFSGVSGSPLYGLSSFAYNNANWGAVWFDVQTVSGNSTIYTASQVNSGLATAKATIAITQVSWAAADIPQSTEKPTNQSGINRAYYKTDGQLLYIDTSGNEKTLGHPIKYKTADETVSSSTALQDDNHLTFAVAANEIWEFDIDAPVTVGVGGIKISVNAPASPTGFTADMQILDGTSVVAMSRITTPDTALENAGALTTGRVKIHGVIENGANAGNVLLRFAQQASDAAATTVKKYSTITYRKIG